MKREQLAYEPPKTKIYRFDDNDRILTESGIVESTPNTQRMHLTNYSAEQIQRLSKAKQKGMAMRLIEGHILRRVHGNAVLVPPPEKDIGFNGMIAVNHTGEFVCKMLSEETDAESLAAALAKEYEIEEDRAKADIEVFLSELRSCNMLEE